MEEKGRKGECSSSTEGRQEDRRGGEVEGEAGSRSSSWILLGVG